VTDRLERQDDRGGAAPLVHQVRPTPVRPIPVRAARPSRWLVLLASVLAAANLTLLAPSASEWVRRAAPGVRDLFRPAEVQEASGGQVKATPAQVAADERAEAVLAALTNLQFHWRVTYGAYTPNLAHLLGADDRRPASRPDVSDLVVHIYSAGTVSFCMGVSAPAGTGTLFFATPSGGVGTVACAGARRVF